MVILGQICKALMKRLSRKRLGLLLDKVP